MSNKVVIGIPVRMQSSRFPGKPLIMINGMSMVQRVYENVRKIGLENDVFVATGDQEIIQHLNKLNIPNIVTKGAIDRPGKRISEACKQLNLSPEDVVVVVQGDEPLVTAEMVQQVINQIQKNGNEKIVVNICAPATRQQLDDPNEVKVVLDNGFNALYFSRAPIPSNFHVEVSSKTWRQVSIFGFRWELMKYFYDVLKQTPLESHESIELLRALESGIKVRMVPTYDTTKSVDTPNDVLEVENILNDYLSGFGTNDSSHT
jgi:3-deoxy-manno-octulosonate cytidylyltransferase (CMP-KDO synthetase)